MGAPIPLDVPEARRVLAFLHAAAGNTDPKLLAPADWIKRFHDVVRSIAVREDQHRHRMNGLHGVTMGRLHRRTEELLREFAPLVEDNPRLNTPSKKRGVTRKVSATYC